MFSRFICIAAYIRISFLFDAEWYSIVWMYHILFIRSFVDGLQSHFSLLAVGNNFSMILHVQVFYGPCFHLFEDTSTSGIAGSYGNFMFNFLRKDWVSIGLI